MKIAVEGYKIKHYVIAEEGITINYKIYSPEGLFSEGTCIYEGNNIYSVEFTPNLDGRWYIEYIFPDGYIIKTQFIVLPKPRLLKPGDTIYLVYHSEDTPSNVKIIKPDGTIMDGEIISLGNNNYQTKIYLDSEGVWLVLWLFNDGYIDPEIILVYEQETDEHKQILDKLNEIYNLLKKHDSKMTAFKFI